MWESESRFSSILNRNWMNGFESFPRYRVVWHFCWNNYEHIWYLSFFSNYLTQFFSTQNLQYLSQNVLFLTKTNDLSTKLKILGFNLKFLHIAENVLHRHYLCCLWQISSMWDENISIKEPVSDLDILI